MRRYNGQLIFSATDLVTFLDCRHATFLDHRQLEDPAPLPAEDPYVELLQQKGLEHERSYREQLRTQGQNVIDIPSGGSLEERTEQTRARSEEHTSELQSQSNIVCRLLLEKKKA